MGNNGRRVGIGVLLRVLVRAFLLQASWSFERMQSLGFAWALAPALRRLYPDDAAFDERLRYHAEYFNTQPYLASFIIGAVVRQEESRAAGNTTGDDIQALKESLMGPLGALGDSFFWGSLKPLAAVIAAAMIIVGWLWGPLLYLLLYKFWHLGLRTGLLFWGYASSGDAVALITGFNFTTWARLFKAVSLAVAGAIVGMMPLWSAEFRLEVPASAQGIALLGAASTILMLVLMRRGGSPIHLMLGLAAFCLALAYLGVIG